MIYPSLDICRRILFPYIRENMSKDEPAPDYQHETSGIKRLDGVFQLMKRDEYEGKLGKAAYMFCSIIDSHHFSNGNKRLAVALLVYFLLINGYHIHAPNMEVMKRELAATFPNLQWQKIHSFSHSHEYFFYHLALIIADRSQKGRMTFTQEQTAVRTLLDVIVV